MSFGELAKDQEGLFKPFVVHESLRQNDASSVSRRRSSLFFLFIVFLWLGVQGARR